MPITYIIYIQTQGVNSQQAKEVENHIILSHRETQLLVCNITSEGMANFLKDRGHSEPRTLEGLQADYERFQSAGGYLKNAKLFHNVIAPHFLDVPISQESL